MTRIYLDYNASTPIDPAVAAAMRPFLEGAFGNPSSSHWASAPAKAALEEARGKVAAMLGAESDEVVFTSGGSEANNLAVKGAFFALAHVGDHIITTAVEHPSVLAPCGFIERLGGKVSYLPVDAAGRVDPDEVRRAITARTVLISVMHAPTTRSARSSRSKRSAPSPASTASASTRTRRNRSARSRPESTRSASTC